MSGTLGTHKRVVVRLAVIRLRRRRIFGTVQEALEFASFGRQELFHQMTLR